MFYSLVQTIVCVLLIQGGLYALHLNGPIGASTNGGGGGGGASKSASVNNVGLQRASMPLSGSAAAQLNSASSSNEMLNILSATQHAQHLHAGGSGSGIGGVGGGGNAGYAHTLSKSTVSALDNAGRLSQELADMAQLERERLMLLGLAKQTATANAGTGHHGRPIITGRIQMSPVEEVDGDYASLLSLQQPRGPLYGSVVKEPAPIEEDEYADEEGAEYERARLHGGAPRKYEYGRIVQPADREEYEQAQRIEELDELIEAEPEIDDMLTDLDSYQYLDELLPPEQRNLWGEDALAYAVVGGNRRPHHLNDGLPLLLNPYRTLEELEENQAQPHTLQEMFQKGAHSGGMKEHEHAGERQQQVHEQLQQQLQQQQRLQREQQQQQQQQHQSKQQTQQQNAFNNAATKQRNSGYGHAAYPSHMQLKWQRKRSQQQQQQRQLHQWQRNIFAQQQKQLHHFNTQPQRHSKLSLANSEATATKHLQPNNNSNNNNNKNLPSALHVAATTTQQQSSSSSTSHLRDSGAAIKSEQQQQNQEQTQRTQKQPQIGKENAVDNTSSKSTAAKAGAKLKALQQQQQKHNKQQQTPSLKQEAFLHPNHKRSGGSMSPAAVAAANNGYSSMASQLMLRSARGQRQYDVPQIECPTAMDGMERFACPTPDLQGRYRCIDDHVLCDGFIDCPEGEDEDRRSCMFYKTVKAHLDVLADALLRWARGR